MKKSLLFAAFGLLGLGALSAQNGGECNEAHALAVVRGNQEVRDCIAPYTSVTFYEVGYTVETALPRNGECNFTVYVWAGPNCVGNGPCPAFPTRIVATVQVSADYDVTAVTCGPVD